MLLNSQNIATITGSDDHNPYKISTITINAKYGSDFSYTQFMLSDDDQSKRLNKQTLLCVLV